MSAGSADAHGVVDLDEKKSSDAFTVWWKMCVLVDAHLRQCRWEDDVEVEKTKRLSSVRFSRVHGENEQATGKIGDEIVVQMGE